MTTEIKMARPANDTMIEIGHWLQMNVGPGSYRTIKNGFMGMDDWFWYEDTTEYEDDEEWDEADIDEPQENVVFVFRREADATIFALKWTTQTS